RALHSCPTRRSSDLTHLSFSSRHFDNGRYVCGKDHWESHHMSDVESRLAALEHRVGELEDINAIRRLHWAYGYYIDFNRPDEVRSEEHTSELQSREN